MWHASDEFMSRHAMPNQLRSRTQKVDFQSIPKDWKQMSEQKHAKSFMGDLKG